MRNISSYNQTFYIFVRRPITWRIVTFHWSISVNGLSVNLIGLCLSHSYITLFFFKYSTSCVSSNRCVKCIFFCVSFNIRRFISMAVYVHKSRNSWQAGPYFSFVNSYTASAIYSIIDIPPSRMFKLNPILLASIDFPIRSFVFWGRCWSGSLCGSRRRLLSNWFRLFNKYKISTNSDNGDNYYDQRDVGKSFLIHIHIFNSKLIKKFSSPKMQYVLTFPVWCSRVESNHYFGIRNPMSYPLNDESIIHNPSHRTIVCAPVSSCFTSGINSIK